MVQFANPARHDTDPSVRGIKSPGRKDLISSDNQNYISKDGDHSMKSREGTILCAAVFLILIILGAPSPSFAQYFARFPSGAAFRFDFMGPSEVDVGREFEYIAFAEHVSGTAAGTPLIRVTATPSPIITPIPPTIPEIPLYCDPNNCLFQLMTGVDQQSRKMKFMVDATATPGSVFILKVDVSDNGVGWQNEPDIRVRVKCPAGQQWDATANACTLITHPCPIGQHWDSATNACIPNPIVCTAPCTHLDPNTNTCVSTCTPGQQCDAASNQCVITCSPGMQRDPLTNTCVSACRADAQWNPDTMSCQTWLDRYMAWVISGVVVALVVIGILAVFLLTRKKPAPSPGYKPYYPTAPAAPTLKPGAPQAVKPAAHRPMVIARREEEKK